MMQICAGLLFDSLALIEPVSFFAKKDKGESGKKLLKIYHVIFGNVRCIYCMSARM
jgi:hypothetical protein